MVAETLIAALAREQKRQRAEAAKRDNPEIFRRRFSALYGHGATGDTGNAMAKAEISPAGTATAPDDSTVWEDDETPPERLPDVPTVPDNPGDTPQNAQKRPCTGTESADKPTTPPESENAPTGRLRANSEPRKRSKRANRASKGRRRARKG